MRGNILKIIFEQEINQNNIVLMKRIALLTIAIGGFAFANAQSISPDVIATAGDHYVSSNAQLSWTIGEPVIETVQAGGNIITQGFHQTTLTVTSIDETSAVSLDVSIYPNPTSDRVIISIPDNQYDFTVEMYDLNGKMVMSDKINRVDNQKELDVTSLATSYYLLKLVSQDADYNSTHKIQKTTR